MFRIILCPDVHNTPLPYCMPGIVTAGYFFDFPLEYKIPIPYKEYDS